MLKTSLLRLILAISGARLQNKTPGAHSGQVTKMLKMSFLGLILAISVPGSRIYVFRLAAPWFSAFEAINAGGFMRLD